MPTVNDICQFLNDFAPPELAADWDNVGLLLGDPAATVERLMTCLTVTPEVVDEAVAGGVEMIVTHHPILFRGAKRLSMREPDGRLVWPLARAGVAVYSPHTAFDNCRAGINQQIAEGLGLTDIKPLRPRMARSYKIVVFVPETDLAKVSSAMFEAGAGQIGQYSQCSFRIPGTGTFFGSNDANPTVGQKGRGEEVAEIRLEVVCPHEHLDAVVRALRAAHSYEEPAYDVYPLQEAVRCGHEGRLGRLREPMNLETLTQQIKKKLNAGAVQIVGTRSAMVERLAIACGAAGEFLDDARRAGANVFITGEMRFHDYLRAKEIGLALILPGHYATERPAVEALAERLGLEWKSITTWASRSERDPVDWLIA